MDFTYLDKEEYKGIPLYSIEENHNGLPMFITKMGRCAQQVHRHEYVQIIYVCKGRLRHVINRNYFDLCQGDIFVIPPYVPHHFIDSTRGKFEIIEFEFVPEFISDRFSPLCGDNGFTDFAYLEPFLVTETGIKPRLNLSGQVQVEVESILNTILQEYIRRDKNFELIIKGMLLVLLAKVGREFTRDIRGTEAQNVFERHRDALTHAIEYINRHYTSDISIDDAAKVAMLSPSYFRYLFKQMTHRTFTEYVNHLRISKAKELLKYERNLKVLEICYETGYSSVNNFNRMFRLATGITPRAYRNGGIHADRHDSAADYA